jgi:flavorubredoxin
MKTTTLYRGAKHTWIMLGRDKDKPEKIIDTNQYVVIGQDRTLLIDPGGIELFSIMLGSVLKHVKVEQITDIFASHQDPDIISSLGLWDEALPSARLHSPWIWEGFIRHFGMNNIEYVPLPDEGGTFDLGGGSVLQFIPAHYLHSSGNFNVYDPEAKILMSGDIGAALEPNDAPLTVTDFNSHIDKMKGFHQRWMPSNAAKDNWINRVRKLDIEIMAPQHGRLFKGDDVKRFLDWFEELQVGVAVK